MRTRFLRVATVICAGLLAYLRWGRRRQLTWGATPEEVAALLPGDELVPDPQGMLTTRAITIDAAPDEVWPWLVQLGFGRGGWYSYDLLDNFARPSADRVVPELQRLEVGDVLPVAPLDGVRVLGHQVLPGGRGCRVVRLEPQSCLVLASGAGFDLCAAETQISWGFYLNALPEGRTRLVERIRSAGEDSLRAFPAKLFWELADFLMMRRQLLSLKARIES